MCNEISEDTSDLLSFDRWMKENIMEIIHRNNEFSTVTIKTPDGARSFRASGKNSLTDAVAKAKSYMKVI